MLELPKIIDQFRVHPGKPLRLKDYDPGWQGDVSRSKSERKEMAQKVLMEDVESLTVAQDMLYAADSWSVLVVFQAMDAAGKDGTIKHVMSGVNPQGVQVYSFKHPSAEELDHNFLWRCSKALPERGRIGIFNRSYYEEVLIVRVQPELIAAQRIPNIKPGKKLWEQRYDDIRAFEEHLVRNGTAIVKFFLNVSKEEQRERFLARIDQPEKHWKFSFADVEQRAHWDAYQEAYEDCLAATSTEAAPWFVIPADHKWVTRSLVSRILASTIRSLDLKYPEISEQQRARIAEARAKLLAE
ncbi:MAG: polyphosphate kinase 2 family protein [Planctomycetota bacterium]|nr:polyphosphate kinase 2 family protein [Planctomycetota bacterium]